MKINKIYLAFCVAAIALFFVGRCTSPVQVVSDLSQVNSLKRQIKVSNELKAFHEKEAISFKKQAEAKQKTKVIIRTIYRNDIAANRSLAPIVKDSIVEAMGDDAVLDLVSEVKRLRSENEIDSLSYYSLLQSANEYDLALQACNIGEGTNQLLILENQKEIKGLRKEVRKQRFLKKFFIGVGVIVATILIIKE